MSHNVFSVPGTFSHLVKLPRLNAGETLKLSVTATSPILISKSVSVAIRGKDTKAIDNGKPDPFSLWSLLCFIWPLPVALVSYFALQVWLTEWEKKMNTAANTQRVKTVQKLFHFLDGPLSGRFIAGEEANALYDTMSNQCTRLLVSQVTYYTWSQRGEIRFIKFEMICGEPQRAINRLIVKEEATTID